MRFLAFAVGLHSALADKTAQAGQMLSERADLTYGLNAFYFGHCTAPLCLCRGHPA